MHFREWLILNENIEANLDRWLGDISKYAKPEEKAVLDSLARNQHITLDPPQMANPYRDSTISALKDKGLENLNWLAFSLGYLSAKKYRTEDLEMAVDFTRQLISSGEIPKSRIGSRGWLLTGREVYPKVQEHLLKSQQRSNREERRMRKRGEVASDDERLISLVAQEENLKLYKLRAMGSGTERGLPKDDEEIKARHRILCKYGKGTGWCTASPTGKYHKMYLANNIYIVHMDDKPLYQFVDCGDEDNRQFMNVEDEEVRSVEPKVFSLIRKNANTECYKISAKFKDLDDYKSSEEVAKNSISYRTVYEFLKNNAREPMVVVHALGENAHMITDALFTRHLDDFNAKDYLYLSDCEAIIHDILHAGGNGREEFADWMVDSLSVDKPRQALQESWMYIQVVQNLLTFSGNFKQALRKLAPIINSLGIGQELSERLAGGWPSRVSADFLDAGIQFDGIDSDDDEWEGTEDGPEDERWDKYKRLMSGTDSRNDTKPHAKDSP